MKSVKAFQLDLLCVNHEMFQTILARFFVHQSRNLLNHFSDIYIAHERRQIIMKSSEIRS
jgi:hypothetical protein